MQLTSTLQSVAERMVPSLARMACAVTWVIATASLQGASMAQQHLEARSLLAASLMSPCASQHITLVGLSSALQSPPMEGPMCRRR